MTIEWEEPGPATPSPLDVFTDALKSRPNQWAIYTRTADSVLLADTLQSWYPEFEWTGRRNNDGTATLYARWIGNGAEATR